MFGIFCLTPENQEKLDIIAGRNEKFLARCNNDKGKKADCRTKEIQHDEKGN